MIKMITPMSVVI